MNKLNPIRSQKYINWVKTLPCVVCGKSPCDPHHPKIKSFCGGTTKCSDVYVIPVCHEHHVEGHSIDWQSFEAKHNIDQWREVLKTIELAAQTGIIEVVGI